ncbi:MAG: CsbD family protein [Terracidiphilus sp.]
MKSTVDQIAGRTKRQAAEWTGDTGAQIEGGLQELKGGVQKTWGEAKDAVREADEESRREAERAKGPHSVPVVAEVHVKQGKA